MNIFSTRRHTEEIAAVNSALDRILRRVEDLESAPTPLGDLDAVRVIVGAATERLNYLGSQVEILDASIEDLQAAHKGIIIAVSEGIERTDRAERRIKATVKRARSELAERGLLDPALDSEDHELREVDGKRGQRDGLLPVRGPVEPAAAQASSIRGVPVETLRRVRGF